MNIELGWVDWCMLGVLVLSVVTGALRGLVFEVLAIVGWFVAYFAARWAGPQLAPHLSIGAAGSPLNLVAAVALVFLVTLVVWGILSRLARTLIRATPLSPVDRVLGAAFGLARGGLVLLVLAVLVGYTPAARSPAWRQSIGAAWLGSAVRGLGPLLPSDIAHLLPA